MNVVIVNGSPRVQGNSDLLCDEFARGAVEEGHSVEKISLGKFEIGYCKACYACFKTGKCVLRDDMAEVLAKVKAADALVVASPTYFLTMSGQMKTFIDRLLPEWKDLGGKEVFVIVTGHDMREGLRRTADDLVGIFSHLGNNVRPVIWGEGVWQKGEVRGTQAMQDAYLAGKSL